MKFLFIIIFVMLVLSAGIASCSPDNPEPASAVSPEKPEGNDTINGGGNNNSDNNMHNKLRLTAGSVSFTITLEDNAAVKAFKMLLPMTVNMSEMNGNEKYYYLPGNLPTVTSNPGTIHAGDLLLYGSSCVVLFYKTFSTSYSYTHLGRMDNSSRLVSALGADNVNITFELQ